ncbi:hypothetical protein PACTADRAFT_47895 [Pachysolen tannophilus NRRL Y-2460]|uniref:Uncharacterized protein n=1 Tax=Pachysolen tannophilus NRRL Y-2460 TaxID=669874 RepID=A0A1E4U242_PACTA|nr:hypothetical protein PACTADRAFT_47895 [Pachysolen tannophilus NRRL Y-2460]
MENHSVIMVNDKQPTQEKKNRRQGLYVSDPNSFFYNSSNQVKSLNGLSKSKFKAQLSLNEIIYGANGKTLLPSPVDSKFNISIDEDDEENEEEEEKEKEEEEVDDDITYNLKKIETHNAKEFEQVFKKNKRSMGVDTRNIINDLKNCELVLNCDLEAADEEDDFYDASAIYKRSSLYSNGSTFDINNNSNRLSISSVTSMSSTSIASLEVNGFAKRNLAMVEITFDDISSKELPVIKAGKPGIVGIDYNNSDFIIRNSMGTLTSRNNINNHHYSNNDNSIICNRDSIESSSGYKRTSIISTRSSRSNKSNNSSKRFSMFNPTINSNRISEHFGGNSNNNINNINNNNNNGTTNAAAVARNNPNSSSSVGMSDDSIAEVASKRQTLRHSISMRSILFSSSSNKNKQNKDDEIRNEFNDNESIASTTTTKTSNSKKRLSMRRSLLSLKSATMSRSGTSNNVASLRNEIIHTSGNNNSSINGSKNLEKERNGGGSGSSGGNINKSKISLPIPQTQATNKIKNKLKNSSSVYSINSLASQR